jgi:hypothetical protein
MPFSREVAVLRKIAVLLDPRPAVQHPANALRQRKLEGNRGLALKARDRLDAPPGAADRARMRSDDSERSRRRVRMPPSPG